MTRMELTGAAATSWRGLALSTVLWLGSTGGALACACGCSVFDVGAYGLLPQENDHGGRVFLEWYHANQSKNWIGTSAASHDLNSDKRITTDWFVGGFQYMFNRDWGVMAKLPYATRTFVTDTNFGNGAPDVERFHANVIGDLELMGMYTGFSKDLSTGIMFGVKLPTGNFSVPNFDRDTQIGTGSTDLILGAFHRGLITGDNAWQYFGEVRWLKPVAYSTAYNTDDQAYEVYKPGASIDGAVGIVYNNGYHLLGFDKIAPVGQVIFSHRDHDTGLAADPYNSGYDRIFLSPGVEFTLVLDEATKQVLKVYGDVEFPVYQRVNASPNDSGSAGQLIAPTLFKMTTSYNF